MTDNPIDASNIESLAERAKEMLDRVRGDAAHDAPAGADDAIEITETLAGDGAAHEADDGDALGAFDDEPTSLQEVVEDETVDEDEPEFVDEVVEDETEAEASVEADDIEALEAIDEVEREDSTEEEVVEEEAVEEDDPSISLDDLEPAFVIEDLDENDTTDGTPVIAAGAAATGLAMGFDDLLPGQPDDDVDEVHSDDQSELDGTSEADESQTPEIAIYESDDPEDEQVFGLDSVLDDDESEDTEAPEEDDEEAIAAPALFGAGAAAAAGESVVAGTATDTPLPQGSDLQHLVVDTPEEDDDERRFRWLLPLIMLSLIVLALVWWLSDDDGSNNDNTATPTSIADDDNSASTTGAPTTESSTTEAPTTTDAPTTVAPPATIPATASALLGEASNTSAFADFGRNFGLQALLDQTVDAAGDPIEFTLFAPSDDAMAALTSEEVQALSDDPAAVQALVDYHIVDERITPESLASAAGGSLVTRAGTPISVELDGDEVVLNGSTRIALAGLEAGNGNVHVVDAILQPQTPALDGIVDTTKIQFEVLSARLTPEGEVELRKAAEFFAANPETTALIEGHTDTDGDPEGNLRTSIRRADAVRSFLVGQGVEPSRLQTQGYGEAEPIIVDGVEDKVASRRIEIILR